jgi:sugar fermentation stimulation protein A
MPLSLATTPEVRHPGSRDPRQAGVRVSFPTGLRETRFVIRPNRFLLHCELEGNEVAVHLADPGRLKELLLPGQRVWVRPAGVAHAKDRMVRRPGRVPRRSAGLVSVDTTMPNRLIHERAEGRRTGRVRRLDPRARRMGPRPLPHRLPPRPARPALALEVKSVTLVEDGVALFPDAITARGARHVRELADLARQDGWEAAILFVLQRDDAHRIEAARSIDPAFADALAEARTAGVRRSSAAAAA